MRSKTENIHEGHRKSVRERYIRRGSLDEYDDHQILEMLLFYAISRRDVNPLAHRLINRFGSLKMVLRADFNDLLAEGISENTATLLKLVADIGPAIDRKEASELTIKTIDDALFACHRLLFRQAYESVLLLCLDSVNRVIKIRYRSEGLNDKVEALPKWVVDTALSNNASSVLLAHNHPSGNSEPSLKDKETTALLHRLLMPLGVKLFDHVIVTTDACSSMMHNYTKTGMMELRLQSDEADSKTNAG